VSASGSNDTGAPDCAWCCPPCTRLAPLALAQTSTNSDKTTPGLCAPAERFTEPAARMSPWGQPSNEHRGLRASRAPRSRAPTPAVGHAKNNGRDRRALVRRATNRIRSSLKSVFPGSIDSPTYHHRPSRIADSPAFQVQPRSKFTAIRRASS
jgi:hypothetical protein